MLLKLTTCYSRILYIMSKISVYSKAINHIKVDRPLFEHEGVAGYVETTVEIEIRDLALFSELWESWFLLSDNQRQNWYYIAKNQEGCNRV